MIKNMSSRPWFAPGQSLRLPFIGDPCSCDGFQCGCCGGIKISQINFDRQSEFELFNILLIYIHICIVLLQFVRISATINIYSD